LGEKVIGCSNILWRSDYIPYQEGGILEINDLNVVEEFQNCGIGRALIKEAEHLVSDRGIWTRKKAKLRKIGNTSQC
jgi:GNAT superfamily N-acetyltransferase